MPTLPTTAIIGAELSRERRRGIRRARRAGYPLPVPARVAADQRMASGSR